MTIRAVLFDFSGTLFRLEHESSWFDGLLDDAGAPMDVREQAELMRRLTAPVGVADDLSEEMQLAWEKRDLDPELHREVYVATLRAAGVTGEGMAELLYERLLDPAYWQPYPDTLEALRRLSDAGIPVAVVSNIAWDITSAFDRHGATVLVDELVMSYQEGVIKPDPKIFLLACDRLGVDPADTLMIGDSEEADGGAAAVGSVVAIVEPLPTAQRPTALLDALTAHGVL
ncbi:HAD-IA family hydrolase [Solihabitans fulvus]|uniref:HAD-IA family hydrolase n=1 Tax=Solihabitans fulvus TaxID=1892852 RepID=A0A5B2XH40_9PSEU|nr:HAD-IA family hydrolase [Solihabitans fulvus]KAA2262355.1 HAD-IA family hydrolase [Solihabitans fulvus]